MTTTKSKTILVLSIAAVLIGVVVASNTLTTARAQSANGQSSATPDVISGLNKTPGDFNQASRFSVEIDSVVVPGFTGVTGIESETEAIAVTGGSGTVTHLVPGHSKWSPVTLKRGLTSDNSLFEWRQSIINGQDVRKNVSIIFLDNSGNQVRYNYYQAWICKWEGPTFDASSPTHLFEEITICADNWQRVGQ